MNCAWCCARRLQDVVLCVGLLSHNSVLLLILWFCLLMFSYELQLCTYTDPVRPLILRFRVTEVLVFALDDVHCVFLTTAETVYFDSSNEFDAL